MSTLPFIYGAYALVVLLAALRGRGYAAFIGIILGIQVLIWTALFAKVGGWRWGVVYLQAVVFLHFLRLLRPRMPPTAYRYLVSLPAHFFVAGTMLALPWALVAAVGLPPYGWWLAYVAALLGVGQSLLSRKEEIDIVLDRAEVAALVRHPHGTARTDQPLRIVQITDPHLGPFMSVARLRGICARAVARDPDLILLTGDFLTWEAHHEPELLAEALAPLAAAEGRVFACRGNHDLEAPEVIASACRQVGVRLLIDEAVVCDTASGPVQILGIDHRWRQPREALAAVCRRFPRPTGALRVVLLHDPGAFARLPEGAGDLVLAGHTHGGQVGLVSLGLRWTFAHALAGIPDHGFWARGTDRLYVHRGNGHYGFPLRVGVPAEESLMRVHRLPASS